MLMQHKIDKLITVFTCKLQGLSDFSTSLDEVEELQSLFSLSVWLCALPYIKTATTNDNLKILFNLCVVPLLNGV